MKNRKGKKMVLCTFCDYYFNKKITNDDTRSLANTILYETKKFRVFTTLGSFVEGYVLIASKQHYISMRQLPKEWFNELAEIIGEVTEVLEKKYSPCILFEHGPATEKLKGGCCVDHFHLHAVPTTINLRKELNSTFTHIKIKRRDQIADAIGKSISYFYLEDSKGINIYPLEKNVPSQYIRRIIAEKIGKEMEWDWALFPHKKIIQATIQNLTPLFEQRKKATKVLQKETIRNVSL